ncbi:hypothetical protein G9464_18620 [Halostella sp. JP-L12]|uniref:DUF7266 family protein n=1 Tax=Halostella TaxID=1843185 RepID=UPI000EF7CB4F|nr:MULTISPECIES: hypothetical protein [Halostella]NHN49587.1 hypothetical protein [Halostella sp. JP-L12]
MIDRGHFRDDRRGVSVAVTHILAIGITTILLAGLLISAGSILEQERENAARGELNTIGDRIGGEISSVDRAATPDADERIELETNHPSRVSGSSYTVRLRNGTVCDVSYVDAYDGCLVLSTSELDRDVVVPLDLDTKVEDGAANGGDVFIVYENEPGESPTITIENDP